MAVKLLINAKVFWHFLFLFLLFIIMISLVSAVWYDPFSWFTTEDALITNKEPPIKVKTVDYEWQVLRQSGNEANFDVIFANAKDKKTDICFVLKNGINPITVDLTDKALYQNDGAPVLDNKNKPITIKYETSKCLVNGTYKNGYHILLTEAEAININEYIRLGENSIELGYKPIEVIVYQDNTFNITCGLNVSGTAWIIEDSLQFGYNLTNPVWQDIKYSCHSQLPITRYRNKYYFQDNQQLIGIDTTKFCNQFNPENNQSSNCRFSTGYLDNESYFYAVGYGNDADPIIIFNNLNNGINDGTTTAYNATWINVSNISPYDELLLYYSFDVNTTLALDYSGNGNDGIFYEQFSYTPNGYFGGGITGDALRDYIDTGLKGFNHTTILVWANITPSDGGAHRFFDQVLGIELSTLSGSTLFCRFEGLTDNFVSRSSAISTAGWHQVGCGYNGSQGYIIVDGEVKYSETSTGTLSQDYNLYLGSIDQVTPVNKMDEFMVFNRSLTAQELRDIYNNQSARFLKQGNYTIAVNISQGYNLVDLNVPHNTILDTNISVRLGQINDSLNDTNQLVLYIPFDFGSAYDVTGNGHNGVLDSVIYSSTGGLNGTGAFEFDDANHATIKIPDTNDIYGSMTVMAWVNTVGSDYWAGIVSRDRIIDDAGWNLRTQGDIIQWGVDTANLITGTKDVEDGKWHHVVGTYNHTPPYRLEIYVDGVLDVNGTSNGDFDDGGDDPITIGLEYNGQERYIDGFVDEVRIYNKTLTPAEILTIYNNDASKYNIVALSSYKNLSNNVNFEINTETDFIYLDFNLMSGINRFYSPNLYDNFNITLSFDSGDTCTPEWLNTSWGDYTYIDCLINDTGNYSSNLTQYDANTCPTSSNTTFYDYVYNASCNYCNYTITNTSWVYNSTIECMVNSTQNDSYFMTEYDQDYDICYGVTSIASDLWNGGLNNTYWNYVYNVSCSSDSCTCPASGSNWEINLTDTCNIATPCNISSGNITFTNAGAGNYVIFNTTIIACKITNIENMLGYLGFNAKINVGGTC